MDAWPTAGLPRPFPPQSPRLQRQNMGLWRASQDGPKPRENLVEAPGTEPGASGKLSASRLPRERQTIERSEDMLNAILERRIERR